MEVAGTWGESVQEERAADQDKDRRTAGARQQGHLGRSASTTESRSARLVDLLSYGALASAYEAVDQHVYDRTRHFLRQRHQVQGRGAEQFSREHVYGELAVLDHPEIPLHTNGSERNIRLHVTRRKVSGGTRPRPT